VAVILAIVVGVTMSRRSDEPRLVPAAGFTVAQSTSTAAEDEEWRLGRLTVSPELPLLRPAWLPSGLGGAPGCVPTVLAGPGQYHAIYPRARDGSCAAGFGLVLYGQLGAQDDTPSADGFSEVATFSSRGTTVHVRGREPTNTGVGLPQWALWWNESGTHYDVLAGSVSLDDLVRLIDSLGPVPLQR
jgi:hypothetical protein